MATTVDNSQVDLETAAAGSRHSAAVTDGGREQDRSSTTTTTSSSSDAEGGNEIVSALEKRRESSVSECSVEVVDLEAGVLPDEGKAHLARRGKDCRICHLSFDAANQESGVPIELGCSCKEDLAAAHKQCAEAWFKIKGNKTCEICGSTARNVAGANEAELLEQWNESNDAAAVAPMSSADTRSFWRGHRFLNFLLACLVFAFVISWLFHFNVPA